MEAQFRPGLDFQMNKIFNLLTSRSTRLLECLQLLHAVLATTEWLTLMTLITLLDTQLTSKSVQLVMEFQRLRIGC